MSSSSKSDTVTLPAITIKVLATDRGQVLCCSCDQPTDPHRIALLIKVPGENDWAGLCYTCTRVVAQVLVERYESEDIAAIDHDFFA